MKQATADHPSSTLERGLWSILATPFTPDLTVDEPSLRAEVQFLKGLPPSGLVALGVFGEGSALDSTEQTLVIRTVLEEAGALPVIAGISSRATAVAVEQARLLSAAAEGGLRALMVQAHSADSGTLASHLKAVHDAGGGVGIVLQDYPAASGIHISATTVAEVVQACPFVVAVKAEASPAPKAVADLTYAVDVPVFGGLGGVNLLDELVLGAAGAMTGFSHPEALLEALTAFEKGGFAAARDAFARWLPLANFEGQLGLGLAIRKEMLRRRGIIGEAVVRPPSPQVPTSLMPALEAHLDTLGGIG